MTILSEKSLNYKVKIDMPNIIELISETFDGVLNHMLPNMLIFGGALRDIIAGFGLHHDLDIAASFSEGKKFIQHLEMSSKWIEECVISQYKEQAEIAKKKALNVISPHSVENGMLDIGRNFSYVIKPKFYNQNNVRTFINSSGRKLQVIIEKPALINGLGNQPPTSIVKTVDFTCCGIIMDAEGNVYEIIEGAKNDCLKRVLCINKNANIEFSDLNQRIKKLTNRGWKSEINLAKIKYKQTNLKKKAKKRKINSLRNYIREYRTATDLVRLVINASKMQIFKNCNKFGYNTSELLCNIFKGLGIKLYDYKVDFHNDHNHNIITITCKNTYIASKFKKALLSEEHSFFYKNQKQFKNYDLSCYMTTPNIPLKINSSSNFTDVFSSPPPRTKTKCKIPPLPTAKMNYEKAKFKTSPQSKITHGVLNEEILAKTGIEQLNAFKDLLLKGMDISEPLATNESGPLTTNEDGPNEDGPLATNEGGLIKSNNVKKDRLI